MSMNMHTVTLDGEKLSDVAAGLEFTTFSDKGVAIRVYPQVVGRPAACDGVAACPLSVDMITELRRARGTSASRCEAARTSSASS